MQILRQHTSGEQLPQRTTLLCLAFAAVLASTSAISDRRGQKTNVQHSPSRLASKANVQHSQVRQASRLTQPPRDFHNVFRLPSTLAGENQQKRLSAWQKPMRAGAAGKVTTGQREWPLLSRSKEKNSKSGRTLAPQTAAVVGLRTQPGASKQRPYLQRQWHQPRQQWYQQQQRPRQQQEEQQQEQQRQSQEQQQQQEHQAQQLQRKHQQQQEEQSIRKQEKEEGKRRKHLQQQQELLQKEQQPIQQRPIQQQPIQQQPIQQQPIQQRPIQQRPIQQRPIQQRPIQQQPIQQWPIQQRPIQQRPIQQQPIQQWPIQQRPIQQQPMQQWPIQRQPIQQQQFEAQTRQGRLRKQLKKPQQKLNAKRQKNSYAMKKYPSTQLQRTNQWWGNVVKQPAMPPTEKHSTQMSMQQEVIEAEQLNEGSRIAPLDHPFLFFSERDIPLLRRQAVGSHSAILDHIKKAVKKIILPENKWKFYPPLFEVDFAKRWNEHYGNNLLVLAIHAILVPEEADQIVPLIEHYMIRLSGYKSWEVKGQRGDDVPRAHTLLGMAVAFDFLRPQLDVEASVSIAQKIRDEAFRFWNRVKKGAGWGYQYAHNHMLTCQTALLASALVLQPHYPQESIEWQKVARQPLERTLLLLRYIVDGSDAEGVGYSTYSTRSLFMYILLVRRHYGVDHTHHPWLRAHFDFLLSTTLPGFSGSVGIADAPPTWFYGPEAQLYFLDRFIMQTGHANWLAREIRKRRLARSVNGELTEQDWPMLIHEFLWYAPHIGFQRPTSLDYPRLSVLSDWGVATFGGGSSEGNTFLSFKSSYLHGRGIYHVVHRKPLPWIEGWESFNSGHEHPDQGSFVFYPHGQPFITEGFYGPKYSYLNNVWLFHHSVPGTKQCGGAYLEGQLGECTRWLKWRAASVGDTAADILTADHQNGMVFIAGESAKAYPRWVKVQSALRALFLLNDKTLIIIDHISLDNQSPVKGGNVFFNNLFKSFNVNEPTDLQTYSTSAQTNDGQHHIQWVADVGSVAQSMIHALAGSIHQPELAQKRGGQNTSYYLNVSIPFHQRTNRVAWLLTSGDSKENARIEFVSTSREGVDLLVTLGWQTYRISLATDHRHLYTRYHLHYHGGLAQVQVNGKTTRFGIPEQLRPATDAGPLVRIKKALPWTGKPEVLTMFSLLTLLLVIAALVGMNTLRWLNRPRNIWIITVILINWFFFLLLVFISGVLNYLDVDKNASKDLGYPHSSNKINVVSPPSILLTGLPQGGQDVAANMFLHSGDLFFLNLRQSAVLSPAVGHALSHTLHPCVWSHEQLDTEALASSWVKTLYKKPKPYLGHAASSHNQARSSLPPLQKSKAKELLSEAIERLTVNPSLRLVLGDDMGSWMLKAGWFSSIFGQHAARTILLLQDPRKWVANVLRSKTLIKHSNLPLIRQIQEIATASKSSCDEENPCAKDFTSLIGLVSVESQRPKPSPHKLLATLWTAYTRAVLCLRQSNRLQQHVLRVEDLLNNPVGVATQVYQFIGLPFPPAVRHQLWLVTHSGLQEFQKLNHAWQSDIQHVLPAKEMAIVEQICREEMYTLGYHVLSRRNVHSSTKSPLKILEQTG